MSDEQTPPPESPAGPTRLAGRGIQPRFGGLLDTCRKLLMNRLNGQLTTLFAQVDDTLFECAEQAENNQVQALFFDAMRDIRRLRPQIERHYHQRISRNFAVFEPGAAQASPRRDEVDAGHLELVAEQDYEESLQLSNMVSSVRGRCTQALFALDQRLALLNGGRRLPEASNPFGPQAIAEAFREALAPSSLALRIKTILFMLFDRNVMQRLDELYDALNRQLIEANVLPNLRYAAQRSATRTAPASASSGAATPPEPGAGPSDDTRALLDSLSALLQQLRRSAPADSATASPGRAAVYDDQALLQALNELQQETAAAFAEQIRRPQRAAAVKARLREQLRQHDPEHRGRALESTQADVIELIGMLFDYILDDEGLTDACKTVLSHLHTPYLKLALQDRRLLTDREHPARRLLNAMARAGELYGDGGDERTLLDKLHWLVQRIVQAGDADDALLVQLNRDFDAFIVTLRQRVELRERRAVEALMGRDRLLAARQRAMESVTRTLDGQDLPMPIRQFLERRWADVLVFIHLRFGEQSRQWTGAEETARRLVWSATPLDEEGRTRLQGLRTSLLEDLGKGLKLLGGVRDEDIRRQLQEIVACQHAVQSRQPQLAERFGPSVPESPLGRLVGDAEAERPDTPGKPDQPLSPRAQALAEELRRLEFGARFAFEEQGQVRMLKLSWFSPASRHYLFVDGSGQRVAVKSLDQLAQELESGRARLLPPEPRLTPFVDRALGAIYRTLQRLTGRAADRDR